MQFGTLAGNSHINTRIYEMFGQIDPADVAAFVRKFRTERDDQRFHTFRELVVGSHLRLRGLNARYEQRVQDKTPDWVVYDSAGSIQELIDVTSLHQRLEKKTDMLRTLSTGEVWTGWVTIPSDHIYSKIQTKANAYADLSAAVGKPYTVFLFGEFFAAIDPEEVEHVLYELHGGVFSSLPMLSGLVYFTHGGGEYRYSYYASSAATFHSHVVRTLGGS